MENYCPGGVHPQLNWIFSKLEWFSLTMATVGGSVLTGLIICPISERINPSLSCQMLDMSIITCTVALL